MFLLSGVKEFCDGARRWVLRSQTNDLSWRCFILQEPGICEEALSRAKKSKQMMNPFVAKAYLPQNSKGEGGLISFTLKLEGKKQH
jgi:hypothetical protein